MGSVFCISEKQLAIDIPAQRFCWLLGVLQISLENIKLGTKSLKVPGTYTQRGNEDEDGKHCVAFPGLRNLHGFQKCHSGNKWEMPLVFLLGNLERSVSEARWALTQACVWCMGSFGDVTLVVYFTVHIWKDPYSDIIYDSNLKFAKYVNLFLFLWWSCDVALH